MKAIIPAALGLLIFAAPAALAQTTTPAQTLPEAPPPLESVPPADEGLVDPVEQAAAVTSEEQFANSAAMTSLLLGLAAKQAQANSKNAEVQAFAEKALARHVALVEQLREAAAAGPVAIPVPFGLDMTHRQKLDAIAGGVSATGANATFETRFAETVREISAVASALYGGYAERGENEALTSFARTALPEIEAQAQEAAALASSLGV
jgi:predicted outer membrane protein